MILNDKGVAVMESRERLIKLLDKPKARKYRNAGLYRLVFNNLETVKPGAIAELDKRLNMPPPKYGFYDMFALGEKIKLTKAMADELVKMGIPDYVSIKGEAEPEALLTIINKMADTKRLNKISKEFEFRLSLRSSADMGRLLKLAESMTLDEQDKLAENLPKIEITLNAYNYFLEKKVIEASSIKSVKLVSKVLAILIEANSVHTLGSGLGSGVDYKTHRVFKLSADIVDVATCFFTDTDSAVLVEGITTMLSTCIDAMTFDEIENECGGFKDCSPIKQVHLASKALKPNYDFYPSPFAVGTPHKPNDRAVSCIHKAIELITALKDKMIRVKRWERLATLATLYTPKAPEIPGGSVVVPPLTRPYEIRETGVEYATIKIAMELDATLVNITTKDVSNLIDKCDDLTVYSFLACLPNADKFHDESVEVPAAIDIMELDQVKNTVLVSKGINLNGVNLSNVVGTEAQSKLQEFITACLIAPPTDRKQELYETKNCSIELSGTFKVNQVSAKSDVKTLGINVASGVDVTYENIKPILKAHESIECLLEWLTMAPISDITPRTFLVTSHELHNKIVDILIEKLNISNALANAIAEISSPLPRCSLSCDQTNLELEAKSALANYLAHALPQTGMVLTIPANCRVSTRLSLEIKEFAVTHPTTALNLKGIRLDPSMVKGAVLHRGTGHSKAWMVISNNYYYGNTNHQGCAVYEAMHKNGIDEAANSLDEAFNLDKLNRMMGEAATHTRHEIYASMPCVGFDKDNNYIFKIKEFAEVCNSLISATNPTDGSESGNRAVISTTAYSTLVLHNYFKTGLKLQRDDLLQRADLAARLGALSTLT